ncbi:MAG TPA: M4 family metallopeptidase [Thermoanaerobaculia bacterium]|nr:M4 family metallopeptidase [Thermoanaerobaculia bacterium]
MLFRITTICNIVPAYLLRAIAANGDEEDRVRALAALSLTSTSRGERQALTELAGLLVLPPRAKRRTVYDAHHSRTLPGRTVRAEGERRTRDEAVNEAYDNAGKTYDFFRRVYGRSSVDGRGLGIRSTVHFAEGYNNAQWNGRQMIYGDGDGKYFRRFTSSLDVIAHELTHGVTQYTAALGFSGQCGALAEHFSDVFGILAKQYALKLAAAKSDWIIGADLFTNRVHGRGIRSMKAPGTAYDDPILGRDPQPSHIRDYVQTHGDDRGVHVNCGIPNHAFYRAAMAIGGNAWEVAGKIWYRALTRELGPRARFQQCADATWRAAGDLYGRGSAPQDAVAEGWKSVGIIVREERPRTPHRFLPPDAGAELPYLA